MKLWDLDTQHCFSTLVNHTTEVWDFLLLNDATLVTGSADMDLRVFRISDISALQESQSPSSKRVRTSSEDDTDVDADLDVSTPVTCSLVGSVKRQGRGRVSGLVAEPNGKYFTCFGNDKHDRQLEVYQVFSEEETEKNHRLRLKKARKRQRQVDDDTMTSADLSQALEDSVRRLGCIQMSSRVQSVDLLPSQGSSLNVSQHKMFVNIVLHVFLLLYRLLSF